MTFINNVTDTLFADVSEFQAVVDDSYTDAGYEWLSIRSNDGWHDDANFAANYAWCVQACNEKRLVGFIVYYYWRPDGSGVANHINMVNNVGGPHPLMVSMMDVESGDGNGGADQSDELNGEHDRLVSWLGGQALRVIGYANTGDQGSIWPNPPARMRFIGAGYGAETYLPGQIAHQYTDGQIDAGGLPMGAPPFGNCDMNCADGISVEAFAVGVGLGVSPPVPVPPAPIPPPAPLPAPTPTPAPVDLSAVGDQIFTAAPALSAQFGA